MDNEEIAIRLNRQAYLESWLSVAKTRRETLRACLQTAEKEERVQIQKTLRKLDSEIRKIERLKESEKQIRKLKRQVKKEK